MAGPCPARIPARELRQRRFPVDGCRLAEPVPNERVGVVPVHHRAPHGQPAQAGSPDHMQKRLALRAHAGRGHVLLQLRAGERTFVCQRTLDRGYAPVGGIG